MLKTGVTPSVFLSQKLEDYVLSNIAANKEELIYIDEI